MSAVMAATGSSVGGATRPSPTRRVRVLHLLPDLAIGGGQTIVLNHLRHMDRDRFDVRVAVLAGGGELTDDVVDVTGRQPVDVPFDPARPWVSVGAIARLLRDEQIDLLHVHSDVDRKLGHAAGLLRRVPVVGHLHAEWIHLGAKYPPNPTLLRRTRARFAGRVRDGLERSAVREYVAESVRVKELFEPLVERPISVLDQAIPIERFSGDRSRRATVREQLGIAEETPILICVSRLVEGKGQGLLIEALACVRRRHPGAVLVLVGDGPEAGPLEDTARIFGVHGAVRFLGSRRDVPDLLDASDVFVFASENEGFGLAVLEGMAAGLPAVAFRIPSLQEFVVPGDTGILVDGRDPSALADAVGTYLGDPVLAARHGAAGREVVRARFAPSSVARSFEAVYDTVLAGTAGPRSRRQR